jgi:hypothetical protein
VAGHLRRSLPRGREPDRLVTSSSNTTGMTKGYFQAVGIVGIVTGVILLAIGIPLSLSSTSVEVR